jgi:tRNA threonylcarbamoyladenosine biosynthesis protein TsaB
VIGFDTATADTAVAAVRGDETLFEVSVGLAAAGRPRHATVLLPEIENAAGAAGGWDQVGRLAVGVGPGSFTGLRIGIATARALAQALGLPLVPVSTLEALARGLAAHAGGGRSLLPLIDARRGELFAAIYDAAGHELWPPFVAAPAQLLERVAELGEAPLAGGDGALRFREELVHGGVEIPADTAAHRVAAREICAIGALGEPAGAADVTPVYLRQPDAVRWRDRNH